VVCVTVSDLTRLAVVTSNLEALFWTRVLLVQLQADGFISVALSVL